MRNYLSAAFILFIAVLFISCPFAEDPAGDADPFIIEEDTVIPTGGFGACFEWNTELYMSYNPDPDYGMELYKYDGSSFGMVADIIAGTESSFPINFTAFNGKLYFTAGTGLDLYLYEYDGINPPESLNDKFAGFTVFVPYESCVYDGKLYFAGSDAGDWDLYSYDGTTDPVLECEFTSYMQNPSNTHDLIVFNDKIWFFASSLYNAENLHYLYNFDGTDVTQIFTQTSDAVYFSYNGFQIENNTLFTVGTINDEDALISINSSDTVEVLQEMGVNNNCQVTFEGFDAYTVHDGYIYYYYFNSITGNDGLGKYDLSTGNHFLDDESGDDMIMVISMLKYNNITFMGMNSGYDAVTVDGFELYYINSSDEICLTEKFTTGLTGYIMSPAYVYNDMLLVVMLEIGTGSIAHLYWLYEE